MDNTVIELIKLLKEVSPHVWEVLLRQVMFDAWAQMGVWLFFLFLSLLFPCLAYKGRMEMKKEVDSDFDFRTSWDEDKVATCLLLSIIPIIVVVLLLPMWTGRFYNPEFFALEYLLSAFKP